MGSHGSLPAMKTKPSIIFFTDFDGTITMKDSTYRPRYSPTAIHFGKRVRLTKDSNYRQ